jgi:uncharacterized repeat protein (TIGR03803 family)
MCGFSRFASRPPRDRRAGFLKQDQCFPPVQPAGLGRIFALLLAIMLLETQGHAAIPGTPEFCNNAYSPLQAQDTTPVLVKFQNFSLQGGYVAGGVGMRNRGFGHISISGIPANSTIYAAYLYWDILGWIVPGDTFSQGVFNGQQITGQLVATGGDPCWNVLSNFAYRADVTSLVTSNGIYALTNFASNITDGTDPWIERGSAPMMEGASLVIIYENSSSPPTTILIYEGATLVDSYDNGLVEVTIDGFTAPNSAFTATTTFIAADGQEGHGSADCTFNGYILPTISWNGGDPQDGPTFTNGNLWDTMTTNVTSLISPSDTSATLTVQKSRDCMVWVAQVFSINCGPPIITCPGNITVTTTNPSGAVVNYTAPTVSGCCPPYTINCMPPSGSVFPIGTNTVNCCATDSCGQTNCCFFTVTNNLCSCIGSNTTVAATSFTNLYVFTDNGGPMGSLVLSGNTLYGTTFQGGSSGEGTVFAVNTDGTGFTNLHTFTGFSDGGLPFAGLILSGNTLYGTAQFGGSSGDGTVFAVNTDGTGFTNLWNFTAGSDGALPYGGLILSGNTLYGTTSGTFWDYGSLYGTVFAVNTNGTNFRVLHTFTGGSDGAMPQASLILSGNTLYGTASDGGSSGQGTVFSVNTTDNGFKTLHSFTNGTDGAYPQAGLLLSGNTLYGTAFQGGSSDYGTVFSVNTDGTGFTTLYSFTNGNDGAWPFAGLILSGNTLYGTTSGFTTWGTVFAISTNGRSFTALYSGGGSDGVSPYADLLLSGNTLYGTSAAGGSSGNGTVFALTVTNFATNCLQIQCPSNMVVTACTNIQEFYTPTVTDLACSNVTVWCNPTNGSYFNPGTTNLVTCYATDCCGNSNYCSFTVTVQWATNCCCACISNILVNGNFEDEPNFGHGVVNYPPYASALTGTQIPGWTIATNHAATIHSCCLAAALTISDQYSLNTDGEGYSGNNAIVCQDFSSAAGQVYNLSFDWVGWDYSSYVFYSNPDTELEVSVTDTITGAKLYDQLFAYSDYDATRKQVQHVATSFTGTGRTLRLQIQETPQSGVNDNLFVVDNFCISLSTNCCVPPPANLVLWLPFDETSGSTSANLASPANPGTQVGGPGVVWGAYVGNSLSFNGTTNQYVSVPDYPAIENGTNDFTLDVWVNRATNCPSGLNAPARVILDKRDVNSGVGYSLWIGGDGQLVLTMALGSDPYRVSYNGTVDHLVPSDGLWHFVAVSVSQSPGQVSLYFDGALDSTFALIPTNFANTSPLWVGGSYYEDKIGNSVNFMHWMGNLDEVEVYNRALSASELQTIFYAGPAGKCRTNCLSGLTITCATNKTVCCNSNWSFDDPTVFACCGYTITNSTVTNNLSSFTRIWQVTDCLNHEATCTQTVTVNTNPPHITCPTDFTPAYFIASNQFRIPTISLQVTDDCTPTSLLVSNETQSPPAGTIVSGTSTNVTVTVTDLCGNSTQCTVTVVGKPTPLHTLCLTNQLVVTNCSVPCLQPCALCQSISQSPVCGTKVAPGVSSITVTITDCNGNSSVQVLPLTVAGQGGSFLTNLFNTGVNNNHALLTDDSVDPHYALPAMAVPANNMPGDYNNNAVAVSAACHSTSGDPSCMWIHSPGCYIYTPWGMLNSTNSKWIAPDYTNNGCCPTGAYTYTLNFVLPSGLDTASATISGRWMADAAAGMYLNGTPVPAEDGGTASCSQWTPFTILPGSFISGNNTLDFVVTKSQCYTGLRVEFVNAFANCYTCAPPYLIWITPEQSLPEGSTATFSVNEGGTPPLSYQWLFNDDALENNSHYSGVTNSTLRIHKISYSDAGQYTVIIDNACGLDIEVVQLTVTPPVVWTNSLWNMTGISVTNATQTATLDASFGPDLVLFGTDCVIPYVLIAGTTADFGLPDEFGQIVNVMEINPQAGVSIQVPLIAPAGSNSVNSYTVIMDLYEPDTSLGTPSTLFQSLACCLGSGQDGVALTLDTTNCLHLTGFAAGVPFDAASTVPLPVDAWNRVALVVNDPQDGVGVNLWLFLNGQTVASLTVLTPTGLPINWSNSPPTLFSIQTNAVSPNGEFYVSSIQFHVVAFAPQVIDGMGSPDDGPIPANYPSFGSPPVLAAALANGSISFSWTGSSYVLQETTDLTSSEWMNSALPFTETEVNGNIVTTAVATPATDVPCKFYRLVFRP